MNKDFFFWAKTIFPSVEQIGDKTVFDQKLRVYWMPIRHEARFESHLDKNEIVLWEDCWKKKDKHIKARITSLLGLNQTIFGRDTQIYKIDKPTLESFLAENHMMDVVSAKHKYGLLYKGVLVAVASFSAAKTFYRGEEEYRSVELVRYASLQGVNVVGGLTKLLEHFIAQHKPDDIMTYSDREWSDGEVYEKLGFEKVEQTLPLAFWIHPDDMKRYATHKLPQELAQECAQSNMDLDTFLLAKGYCRIWNQGNNKFLWKLK